MFKQLLAVIILAVFAAGCGVKAETYVMTKDRVDQELTGNSGCLSGECGPVLTPQRKTRRVYVLEVSKPADEKGKQVEEMVTVSSNKEYTEEPAKPAGSNQGVVTKQRAIIIPSIEDEFSVDAKAGAPVIVNQGPSVDQQYTVLKDDTLQKISKKVYGSYSKWVSIYEANKATVKDANVLRPGTVLTIPALDRPRDN